MKLFVASLALGAALLPSIAAAQVDPARAFYAIAFTHGTPHTGVITAQSTTAPFGVLASALRGPANGTITLDPVRSILYGGSCCTPGLTIQAYEPSALTPLPSRNITVSSSGSFAIEVDAPRRVMFHYDTVLRTLRAISLNDGSTYGTVVATTTLTDLPAEPTPTSVGDQIAVDTRAQRVIVTGGDGGPVLAVSVAGISMTGGTFGEVLNTGQRNRTTGNSGGAVAIDEMGRRVFFIPATGTVRVIRADPPFTLIADITVPSMAANDCGLSYDARTGNLYVGRGGSAQPAVVAFPAMTVTAFATGPGEVPALSFAGGTTACVDRDEDGFLPAVCAPMGARVDCDDTRRELNPDAMEICNGRDDDCDGLSDENFCRIDGTCFNAGQANPANACQVCVTSPTASAPSTWSNAPSTTMCRAAAGACDVAETCDGMGACAPDGFAPSTTVCRASASITACDPAESCTGTSATCPADAVTRAPTEETCNSVDDDCDGMTDEPPCMPVVPMPDASPPDAEATDLGPETSVDDVAPADVAADVSAPDATPTDPPDDAATMTDASAPPLMDVAVVTDAPAPEDVAVTPDAAVTQDAAVMEDVAVTQDVPFAQDGPRAVDPAANQSGGCGCAVPGAAGDGRAASLLALAAAVVALSRRRRRS